MSFRTVAESLSVPLRKVFPHVTENLFRYAAALTGSICTYTKSPGHNTLGYKLLLPSGRTSETSVKEELEKLENIACFDSRNSVRRTKNWAHFGKRTQFFIKCLLCAYSVATGCSSWLCRVKSLMRLPVITPSDVTAVESGCTQWSAMLMI